MIGESGEVRQMAVPRDDNEFDVDVGRRPTRRRRRRRSTLGWLQSALRMCDMGFTSVDRRCRRIDVDDGHVHMKIILQDEWLIDWPWPWPVQSPSRGV